MSTNQTVHTCGPIPESGCGLEKPRADRNAFAVLNITPCRGAVLPDKLNALRKQIAGVGALRVDGARGKIHILYDDTVSSIGQIECALRAVGYRMRQERGDHG